MQHLTYTLLLQTNAKQKPSVSSTFNVYMVLQMANSYNHILDMNVKCLYFIPSFGTTEAEL